MKRLQLIALLLLCSGSAQAIPIYNPPVHQVVVGYKQVVVGYTPHKKKHWGWTSWGFWRVNKVTYTPIYATLAVTSPVPEPQTYAMLLVGMGLVALRTRRKGRPVAVCEEYDKNTG